MIAQFSAAHATKLAYSLTFGFSRAGSFTGYRKMTMNDMRLLYALSTDGAMTTPLTTTTTSMTKKETTVLTTQQAEAFFFQLS